MIEKIFIFNAYIASEGLTLVFWVLLQTYWNRIVSECKSQGNKGLQKNCAEFTELWPKGVCPSVYSQDIFQRDMLDHLGSAICSWKGLAYLGLLSPTCERQKKENYLFTFYLLLVVGGSVAKSCLTVATPWTTVPIDYSLPGSSVHGIFQAGILEWVVISFSRGSSWPRNWTRVSCTASRFFTNWAMVDLNATV